MATRKTGKAPVPPKKKPSKPAAPKKAAGKVAPATTKKKAAPAVKKSRAKVPQQIGLTDKEREFVSQYLIDLNGTQAAIRAKYSPQTARQQASRLLSNVYIQQAIAEARTEQQLRTQITADRVVREIALVAFADPRELVQIKKGCCRHCWGEGFKFQRTLGELNFDQEQWLNKGNNLADFDAQGGPGYSPLKQPHPNCPECGGDGNTRIVLSDTRELGAGALALYAGAKEGKYGIELLMHSKMDAIEKLAKHLGIYEKDNQQKTDPLASLLQSITQGSNNGFKPVQDDPEVTDSPTGGGSSLQPRQELDDES